jgi:hypothetical protein
MCNSCDTEKHKRYPVRRCSGVSGVMRWGIWVSGVGMCNAMESIIISILYAKLYVVAWVGLAVVWINEISEGFRLHSRWETGQGVAQ